MTLFSLRKRLWLVLLMALSLASCSQWGGGPEDEEKDPHFLAGVSRESSMDYDGAISAFESALVSNPKSAAAHLRLGLLYESHKNDYAAAIYHFEKHLELKPESNMAEAIRQHVVACKLELAKTVPFALVNRYVQDEMRRLSSSNAFLNEQVVQLKAQVIDQATTFSNKMASTLAQFAAQNEALSQSTAAADPPERSRSSSSERSSERSNERASSTPAPKSVSPRAVSVPRTHEVKSGETLATIARQYNIRVTALQAANPRVEARRLKVGQILFLPSK